ncbi:peroxiredoxin family protein [Saccharicrinis sp. FJH54]|uniref:peroxiredoxin family protein n=1 Tax=Saccharicrinis sp. FJH54 TaxID=3344665 RepID=UPI0035D51A49
MKRLFLFLSLYPLLYCFSSAQVVDISNLDSATVILDQTVQGETPWRDRGINITSDSILTLRDAELTSVFPEIRNIPDGLSRTVTYHVIVDEFQFYYQNYLSGNMSKTYFEDKMKHTYDLKDTVYLTSKKLKTFFTIVAGFNDSSELMYIVDANTNNDLSDDSIRILEKIYPLIEDVMHHVISVDMEAFDGTGVVQLKKDVCISGMVGSCKKPSLYCFFPEYNYGLFKYGSDTFRICKRYNGWHNSDAFVFENDKSIYEISQYSDIHPSEYVKFGDYYYQYADTRLKNTGVRLVKFNPGKSYKFRNEKGFPIPVSEQEGMIAPEFFGNDILSNEPVSTNSYRDRYVLLLFWHTESYSRDEYLRFTDWVYNNYYESDIKIIGVLSAHLSNNPVEIVTEYGMSWTNIDGLKKVRRTPKGTAAYTYLPSIMLIDPNGIIVKYMKAGFRDVPDLDGIDLPEIPAELKAYTVRDMIR